MPIVILELVSQNPVSIYQGGYGKPLGNKDGADLTGLLKLNFVESESVLFTL